MSASAGDARQAPTFSFLCTAYRTEAYLADTIESVQAQTRGDWELVVVDNGMSEEIVRIVRSYSDTDTRVRLVRQENRGISGGVNAAAAAAQGRYLVVLNSDDQVLPEYCLRLSAVLDEHPEVDAVGCDAVLFSDEDGIELKHSFMYTVGARRPLDIRERLTVADVIGGQQPYYSGAVRREAWDAVCGYVTETPKVEDLSLWVRLIAAGFDVRAVPDRLGRFRVRGDSVSRDPDSVESFGHNTERALALAAQSSGRPEDCEALRYRLSLLHYHRALRRARWAFLDGDVTTSRDEARRAFGARRTVRSAMVVGGLTVAPGLLRRMHPVKQWLQTMAGRILSRMAPPVPQASLAPTSTRMSRNLGRLASVVRRAS